MSSQSTKTMTAAQQGRRETSFIETSGGLLTEQLITKLRDESCSEDAVQPETFKLTGDSDIETDTDLESEISEAWEDLKERWDTVSQNSKIFGMDTSTARTKWIIPLLESLGFDPAYQQANLVADNLKADLSHIGWSPEDQLGEQIVDGTPPITHLVQPDKDESLDSGDHIGSNGKSPHDELQQFLNAADQHWSIVTDGLKLRLLRDYYHTYTRGYVEFDLENIFTNRNYEDFRALYRLCHVSRFVPRGDEEEAEAPLESLYQVALATGVKVGEDLQSNVVEALETLGNGFLSHNQEIREALEEGGQEESEAYYQDLLRIVYRLLFLLFAEQRGMMADRGDLYTKEYSISALREQAERKGSRDHQTDLWEGVKITFHIVGQGVDEDDLQVPAYNGGLFDDEKLKFVSDATCDNEAILSAIHNLTHVEQQGYQQRISYADLGVEEIGAVYESLLEFSPKLAETTIELENRDVPIGAGEFYLDDRGIERKETGSYYTEPELVQELVTSALKPVVDDSLEDAGDTKEEKEAALLDISVCDPACGSAAFLIAATNYLGKRLAQIREGTEFPPQEDIRTARRSVLQHCIYGVDLNPMAVELAKVSLWIDSAVKDKPLNFLDHHIKCGNSLVGASDELVKNRLPEDAYDTSSGRDWHVGNDLRKRVRDENKKAAKGADNHSLASFIAGLKEQASLVEQLSEIEDRTVEDVERKGELYRDLREGEAFQREKRTLDVWTAAFFWPMRRGETAEYPTPETIDQVRRRSNDELSPDLQQMVNRAEEIAKEHRFFHWELEFPEVFSGEEPGFDCILGNPPFMGGLKISTHLGSDFLNWLQSIYSPFGGTADLCAAFYRRAFNLLRTGGKMGMVATNTIGQGDTRENGLAVILEEGGIITFARRFVKWSGTASVEVNLLTIRKDDQSSPDELPEPTLDGRSVDFISSRLDVEPEVEPQSLQQNENRAFIGDYVRGKGFVLDQEEAESLIAKNPRNEDCIFPYLNGEDLNSHPEQKPSRHVICFHDWDLERAQQYPDLLDVIKQRVKPEREKLENKSDKRDKKYWWRFARYRGEMRRAISPLERIMVRSRVSDLHSIAFAPKDYVFADATVVFAFEDNYHFALLQSSIHELWLRKQASSMRTDIRYTPSSCFEMFPFPKEEYRQKKSEEWDLKELCGPFSLADRVGREYRDHRSQIMSDRELGLTKTYNLFHNPECSDSDIERLRELRIEMDQAILACYDWGDLDPEHDFYQSEREEQTRFTFSSQAQHEVRKRLLELNVEVTQGHME